MLWCVAVTQCLINTPAFQGRRPKEITFSADMSAKAFSPLPQAQRTYEQKCKFISYCIHIFFINFKHFTLESIKKTYISYCGQGFCPPPFLLAETSATNVSFFNGSLHIPFSILSRRFCVFGVILVQWQCYTKIEFSFSSVSLHELN